MSVFSAIGRLIDEYSAARTRYLTERSIRSLPSEIQKDIGWPDLTTTRVNTRLPTGAWAGDR